MSPEFFFVLLPIFDDLVKSLFCPILVIPAPIFIGINSSRNPVFSKAYKYSGLRFSPVCQAQAGRSDDFLRIHQFLKPTQFSFPHGLE